MVRLLTDTPAFFNDISEEIRLFLGFAEITSDPLCDAELTVELHMDADAGCVFGKLLPDGTACRIPILPDGGDPLERKRQQKRAVKLAAYRLLDGRYGQRSPWGSLTGIRPTKLWRDSVRRIGEAETERLFRDTFSVSDSKTALVRAITAAQAPLVRSAVEANYADVYLGIPYCKTRCLYCSFGAEVARGADALERYLFELMRDIAEGGRILRACGYPVRAVYFGGGTPTVLSAAQLDCLLGHLRNCYDIAGREFTVEAGRPDTITRDKLTVLSDHGVTRLSVNPQTMCDETLRRIGRLHTAAETEQAFLLARALGFREINMDLIAGLPGETPDEFARTLARIEALAPDNLTVHTLAVKRSSRLKEQLDQYPLPDASAVSDMLDAGAAAAARMGMRPYYMYRQKYMQGNLENVGYARPGTECVYNVDMMEELISIMAHGAGAMTKRVYGGENRVERLPNPKDVPTYSAKQAMLYLGKYRMFSD